MIREPLDMDMLVKHGEKHGEGMEEDADEDVDIWYDPEELVPAGRDWRPRWVCGGWS